MITATSSISSGILSSAFGTPSPTSVPGNGSGSTSSQASLVESLLGTPDSFYLSNLTFAQDTEALLQNPRDNGALTGTPSSYVQQIINALAPGATHPAGGTQSAATSGTAISDAPASGLPPEGILA